MQRTHRRKSSPAHLQHIFALGPKVSTATDLYQLTYQPDRSTACVKSTGKPPAASAFSLGAEIPISTFVEIKQSGTP